MPSCFSQGFPIAVWQTTIKTARLAAAGAFPYFGQLKMFPLSNSNFDIVFKEKNLPDSKGMDFRAMICSPEVLYDFDKGKVRLIRDIV